MSSIFNMYGFPLGERFSEGEIENYMKTLKHDSACNRKFKNEFNRGDKIVGQVHLDKTDIDYVIYSCAECGGHYRMESVLPQLQSKKGR